MVPNRTVARTILNSYDPIGDAEGYWYAMSDLFADEFLGTRGKKSTLSHSIYINTPFLFSVFIFFRAFLYSSSRYRLWW